MSKPTASVESQSAKRLLERFNDIVLVLAGEKHTRAVAAALFFLAVSMSVMHRPLAQPELGDGALYDYIGQSILRGQLPYRDVVDIKTPGSMYLSAVAMAAGKVVGLRDVIAVRFFQIMLAGLLSVVTFFVARSYLRDAVATLIAPLFLLMSSVFAEWTVAATQPKLPMILFGMVTLLLIARDEPFWAGVASMLSFLCWQPGLMFTGVAFLVFSRYFSSWRDLRALKVVIGGALPLAVVAGYFYSRGVLGDLWAWTITYNYSVYRPETHRELLEALTHLWRVTTRIFGVDVVLVGIALIGFFVFAAEQVRERLSRADGASPFRDALLIPPVVYFAFCIISMQAGPDLIPFFPLIGIFAGLAIVRLGKWLTRALDNRSMSLSVPALVMILMLVLALGRAAMAYLTPLSFTLQNQDRDFKVLADELGPDGRIYVQGPIELLVMLNRPNLNPYLLLNKGADNFAAARRGGEFATIISEMETERPKLVALSRLQNVKSRDLLQQWVTEHYDRLESFTYTNVYVRKDQ